MTEAVDSGGIDPIDTEFDRPAYRGNRFGVVLIAPAKAPITAANGPRAEADRRDRKVGISELPEFYRRCLARRVFPKKTAASASREERDEGARLVRS
jgi:hypothetical protein